MADFQDNLPPEMWSKIFSFLENRELFNCCLVRRSWLQMIRKDPNLVRHLKLKENATYADFVDLLKAWPNLKILEMENNQYKKFRRWKPQQTLALLSKLEKIILESYDHSFLDYLKFTKVALDHPDQSVGVKNVLGIELHDLGRFELMDVFDLTLLSTFPKVATNLQSISLFNFGSEVVLETLFKNQNLVSKLRKFTVGLNVRSGLFGSLPILNISTLGLTVFIHDDNLTRNFQLFEFFGKKCPKVYRLEIDLMVPEDYFETTKFAWHLMEMIYLLKMKFPTLAVLEMQCLTNCMQVKAPEECLSQTFNYLIDNIPSVLPDNSTFKLGFKYNKRTLVKFPMKPPKIVAPEKRKNIKFQPAADVLEINDLNSGPAVTAKRKRRA